MRFANMTSSCIVLLVPLTLNARVELKSIRGKKKKKKNVHTKITG